MLRSGLIRKSDIRECRGDIRERIDLHCDIREYHKMFANVRVREYQTSRT